MSGNPRRLRRGDARGVHSFRRLQILTVVSVCFPVRLDGSGISLCMPSHSDWKGLPNLATFTEAHRHDNARGVSCPA